MSLHVNMLHVGDVVHFKIGDVVPVDGLVIESNNLATNEAAMTGESDERLKQLLETCVDRRNEMLAERNIDNLKELDASEAHALPSPLMLSGTNVEGGSGKMLALVVGENSALGEIMKKLEQKNKPTPLQEKLEEIATEIGKLGTYAALLTVHVLLFRYFLDGILKRNIDLFGRESDQDRPFAKNLQLWVDYVVIGVAVIVVAVPEGLPLAVMISLAYSQKKMLADQNFVKKLAACEIMGGATNICSDKTGTLTLNQMKVAATWLGKEMELPTEQDENKQLKKINPLDYFHKTHWDLVKTAIACNTPNNPGATDKGMVDLLERCDINLEALRKHHKVTDQDKDRIRFDFSSSRKRMSTIIQNAHGKDSYDRRLVIKGASELICASCVNYIDENGEVQSFGDSQRQHIDQIIKKFASKALRTIALAYRDLEPNLHGQFHEEPRDKALKDVETQGLTLIGILGIYDVIRSEVPEAVRVCQRAGVTVRMVTGDNIITAKAIAVKCGIITEAEMDDRDVCDEGPEFYNRMEGLKIMEDGEERVKKFSLFKEKGPKLKVMARSRPEDKYLLVTGLMNMGEVVAVTGDGTNDAPALSKADVGFGMGLTGTKVCKAAADIIIQDDSFSSVVKACSWGRNVYDNIKRFLQFQLTVNVNALIFTVVGAIILKESPLQAIQLLWVNMIMDSLASLALATELPRPELLDRPPQVRDDYIVSRKMTKHIIWMAIFQMVILFIFLFGGEYLIPEPNEALRYNFQR